MIEFIRKWFSFGKNVFVLTVVPVMFTVIFSLVYSHTYVEQIPFAVLDLDRSTTSRTVISAFEDSVGFGNVLRANTEQEVQDGFLSGEVKAALVLPEGFERGVKAKQSPRALVMVDGSNIFVGNSAYSYAANVMGTLNAGIQLDMLNADGMVPFSAERDLSTLSFVDRMLYAPQMGNFVYAFAGYLGIFIQQTYMSVFSPTMLAEKRRLSKLPRGKENREIMAARIGKECVVYGLLTVVAFLACLLIAHYAGGYPLRGNLFTALLVQLVFLLDLTAVTIFITVFFVDTSNCIQFLMLLSIPTFLTSAYIWPEFAMPQGFAAVIRAVWPLHYYANPLRDIMLKGAGIAEVSGYLAGGLLFAAVWFPVALLAFRKKVRAMKQAAV